MGSNPIFSSIYETFGDVLQLAECMLCKHKVTGSNPVISNAFVAQLAEHSYGKGKVPGSNPDVGCKNIIFMEIQLVLKSHEQALVTKASQLVIFFAETLKRKTSQDWNLTVQPLPTQLKKYTLLRSPHVNKKSREQVQLKTCQVCIRLTKIKKPLAFLIILDGIKLLKLDGIQLKCSFKAHTSV